MDEKYKIFPSILACFFYDQDFKGFNVGHHQKVETPEDCQRLCQDFHACNYFTALYIKENEYKCYMKSARYLADGVKKLTVSGPKYCRKYSVPKKF